MSRLPVSGLPLSTTDQSSAAAAAHIQPSETQANSILEQNPSCYWTRRINFLKKQSEKKKSDGYICGQWYHTQHCLF